MGKRFLNFLAFFAFAALFMTLLTRELTGILLAGSVCLPIFLAQESTFAVISGKDSFFMRLSEVKALILGVVMFICYYLLYALAYRLIIVDILHLM